MKTIILFILALFIFSSSRADLPDGIYKTYDDYVNNKSEPGELTNVITFSSGANFAGHIEFKTPDAHVVKYKFDEIWGFAWRGFLFRTVTEGYYGNSIAAVSNNGKLVYYRDGIQLFRHLKFNKSLYDRGFPPTGRSSDCFISLDLQSPMIAMPTGTWRGNSHRKNHPVHDWLEFVEAHPEHHVFTDCISDYSGLQNVTNCIEKYNGKKCLIQEDFSE